MKARIEHRVPLSRRATEILRELERDRESGDDYVFAGQRERSPLSNMALLMMLRRMKRGDITAHGFRSTLSDGASEVSSFSGELRETALAHDPEQGRARLPSRRRAGKEADDDGGLGELVPSDARRPSLTIVQTAERTPSKG